MPVGGFIEVVPRLVLENGGKMKITDKIKKVKFSDLKPYPKNQKKHSKRQIEMVRKSIRNNSYVQPIVVDKKNVIIIGHCRYEAMKKDLKDNSIVEVIDAGHLTAKQAKKLRIADNKLNESDWNDNLIDEITNLYPGDDLTKFDFDEIGFDIDEIEKMLPSKETEGDDDIPKKVKTITKLGDLWELGRHRLLCGDSTSEDDVGRLMNGETASMCHTDPPYNVFYGESKNPRHKIREIKNDKQSLDDWIDFNNKLINIIKNCVTGDFYMWGGSGYDGMKSRCLFIENGLHWSATIIWKKQQLFLFHHVDVREILHQTLLTFWLPKFRVNLITHKKGNVLLLPYMIRIPAGTH